MLEFSVAAYFACTYFRESLCQFVAGALTFTFTYVKTPGPFAAEGAWFIRADWRFPWVAERQVCALSVFPLSNNVSPFVL